MSRKSKVIICLLALAVVLFCLIQFWLLPAWREGRESYAAGQTDALTHDISAVYEYESEYVGDAPNTAALFMALPLCDVQMKLEIDSEVGTLTVNYLDTVWDIGEEKVRRDLVYNSVAAMAAIDNLDGITYRFTDNSYSFTRRRLEEVLGAPLSRLLESSVWSEEVRSKLENEAFLSLFYAA